MINKKNLLGKEPESLGLKDAIHTAIVSVRAAEPITPGERIGLNEFREAVGVKADALGVADPFLKAPITTGQIFWMLLNQDEVPNVRHVWEHPTANFTPPDREVFHNRALTLAAKQFGVTYSEIMAAAAIVVKTKEPQPYPGKLSVAEFDKAADEFDRYDFWSEWANEASHDFYNSGSECCPEYNYPRELFTKKLMAAERGTK